MNSKPRRRSHYTFMVIPHDARGKTFSLKISSLGLYALIGVVIFSLLFVSSSVVYSSLLTRKMFNYANAIAVNRRQQKVIDTFSQRTEKVQEAISELVKKDNELRGLLGLKNWKSTILLSSTVDHADIPDKVSVSLQNAGLQLEEKRQSLEELKEWVKTVRSRYASTPSCWPIYGRIVSLFGYRVSPWRGFHTGLDISGRYGAPVRATADGVVSFAGWRKGYGRTITLDHGRGTSSLYAHCSRFAVNAGQKVKKGQVICFVGNTGYTTGPHLHYEVRKASRPVNPVSYLDLNILSASKMWTNNQ